MHRTRLALSQVKALSRLRPGSGIPSISTAYAQAWRRCAQVIHMLVHRQRGRQSCLLAGWQQRIGRAGAGVPDRSAGCGDLAQVWIFVAPGRQPPDDRCRPADSRPRIHRRPAGRDRHRCWGGGDRLAAAGREGVVTGRRSWTGAGLWPRSAAGSSSDGLWCRSSSTRRTPRRGRPW